MNKPQASPPKHHVILYTRPGCHLCGEAKQAMRSANCANEYTLEEINIESDSQLLHQYGYDVPVIKIDGREVFRHRLSPENFKAALQDARQMLASRHSVRE